MEVAPTAHYSMGGIVVDPETHATDLPGLFAVGECTAGLHGANRLGGNSLAETVVFGRRVGEAAAAFSRESDVLLRSRRAIEEAQDDLDRHVKPGEELARPLQRALRNVLWEDCGVVRDEAGLRRGLARVADLRTAMDTIDVRPSEEGWGELAHALDLRAGLATAEATIRCALARNESRGAHFRADHPTLDESLGVNFYSRMDEDGSSTVSSAPVPPAPNELDALAREGATAALKGRLLE
jgi:succinate dehydrogenase / fumarate reductase flavoprotein subunit